MGKIITQCPSCDSSKLHVVKIECADCNTIFEGKFSIPALLKLPEEDLQFILDKVRNGYLLISRKELVLIPLLIPHKAAHQS
jgi:hypothetical protein